MNLLDSLRYHLDGTSGALDSAYSPVTAGKGRKGKYVPSVSNLLRSFVAVDFETANRVGGASACQVAMVKVADFEVVDAFCTYLRPPEEHLSLIHI